jgi:hypothetical protein
MSGQHVYYTLITSLPWLPRFDRAEHLPISQERLNERLRMLEPDDARVVRRGLAFWEWREHPTERTDAEMVERYHRLIEVSEHPVLKQLIDYAVDQRTIVVALRRRQRDLPAPQAGEPWGVGRWVHAIERHWDDGDFRLGQIYPWIAQAKAYLEQGATFELERYLMEQLWTYIERAIPGNNFGFEFVLAYLFKWRLVQQWLSYNVEAASARFDGLLSEVMHEHQQLFE